MTRRTRKFLALLTLAAAPLPMLVAFTPLYMTPPPPNEGTQLPLLSLTASAMIAAAGIHQWNKIPRSIRPKSPKKISRRSAVKAAYFLDMSINLEIAPYTAETLRTEIARVTNGHPEQFTVGQLEDFLCRILTGRTGHYPVLRPVFYQVRAALTEMAGPHQRIYPSTELRKLFPIKTEKRVAELYDRLGCAKPRRIFTTTVRSLVHDLANRELSTKFVWTRAEVCAFIRQRITIEAAPAARFSDLGVDMRYFAPDEKVHA